MKLALGYENIYHKLQGHKVKLTLQGDIWLHLVDTHFLSFTFEVEVSFHAGHRKSKPHFSTCCTRSSNTKTHGHM